MCPGLIQLRRKAYNTTEKRFKASHIAVLIKILFEFTLFFKLQKSNLSHNKLEEGGGGGGGGFYPDVFFCCLIQVDRPKTG